MRIRKSVHGFGHLGQTGCEVVGIHHLCVPNILEDGLVSTGGNGIRAKEKPVLFFFNYLLLIPSS